MEENFLSALYLMIIGMATVFTVLALIVWSGQLLIRVVNRYSPADNITLRRPAARRAIDPSPSPSQLAAIIAAVSVATNGQGRVIRVEKERTPTTK